MLFCLINFTGSDKIFPYVLKPKNVSLITEELINIIQLNSNLFNQKALLKDFGNQIKELINIIQINSNLFNQKALLKYFANQIKDF